MLQYKPKPGIETVTSASGHKKHVPVHDVRAAVCDDELAKHIIETNYQREDTIDAVFDENAHEPTDISGDQPNTNHPSCFDRVGEPVSNDAMVNCSTGSGEIPPRTLHPSICDHLEVIKPHDDQNYCGIVSATTRAGVHTINYVDGEVETLNLANETWRTWDNISANATGFTDLSSDIAHVVKETFDVIGIKTFLFHEAQAFPSHVMLKAYEKDESVFKQHVKCEPVSDVPRSANIISSHTVYNVKKDYDCSLQLKARIVSHNGDSVKHVIHSDCAMCSPTGIRSVLTISALNQWVISRAEFKAALLQTGQAQQDVFVRLPCESQDKRCYWLLLSAAYGLRNANAKF